MSFLILNRTTVPQTITITATPYTIPAGGSISRPDGDLANVVLTAATVSLFIYQELLPLNSDGSAYTGSIPTALDPSKIAPASVAPVTGRALVAVTTAASTAIGTAPATWIWTTVSNTSPDLQYDAATGVYTFTKNQFWVSNAQWYIFGSTNRDFYADAETSTDGGTTWVRGSNSLRVESATTTGRTVNFTFPGYFPAGSKLRFVVWSSGAGVTVQTLAVGTSTAAASRLTVLNIDGVKVQS